MQIQKETADLKLWERLSDHYSPTELLLDVLKTQHKDVYKSGMLLPKLKVGCEQFMEKNSFDDALDTRRRLDEKLKEA